MALKVFFVCDVDFVERGLYAPAGICSMVVVPSLKKLF